MLKLFINDLDYTPNVVDIKLERLYFVLGMELNKLKNYYRDSRLVVKRPNMLITLLTSMDINILENDIDKVKSSIDVNAIYLSNKNGIVSNLSSGTIMNSVIIKDMNEVFMYIERYDIFNLEDIDILNTNSINVLSTTIDTMMLGHPTRYKNVNNMEDITVYEIDVRMLALQYYYWARDEMYLGNDIDIARFIYTNVFVNMMDSMFNISLLNRYFNKMDDTVKDINNENISNPIATLDICKRIDKRIDYIIKNIYKKRRKVDYKDFLKDIALLDTDGYKVLNYNNLIYTNRNEWVYWLSRVWYMDKIIEINGNDSLSKNIAYTQNIRYDVKSMIRSKSIDKLPDIYFKNEVMQTVKKIIDNI